MSTALLVLFWISQYFVFKKMGREGWIGLIPLYSQYVLFEELYGDGWKFLTLIIPIYNIYVLIKLNIDLAHEFNQSTGFGIGLFFLSSVFYPILGLSSNIQFRDGSTYASVADSFGSVTSKTQTTSADELLKLKELLDMGAITQEEFDLKKKEILGL